MADSSFLWQLILVMGVGTFVIRLSFIQIGGYLDGLSESAEKGLDLVPPAVLAALVFPRLVLIDGSPVFSSNNPYLITGILAGLIAWKTDSLLLTVGIGLGVLWGLQYLL